MFDLLNNIWVKFDNFLLSKCQNFSDKFQRKTGKTNFSLAKTLWYMSISACVLLIVSLIFFAAQAIPLFIIALFSVASVIFPIIKAEKIILKSFQDKSETLPAEIVKERKRFSFSRQLWLFVSFIALYLVFFISQIKDFPLFPLILAPSYAILISFSFYFASCATIPPIKGKIWQTIKEWLVVKKLLPVKAKV